jgi:hypothetical protein
MKDKIPNPRQYFIKDYLYYTGYTGYNYQLPVISRRYSEQTQYIKEITSQDMFLGYTNVIYAIMVFILKVN